MLLRLLIDASRAVPNTPFARLLRRVDQALRAADALQARAERDLAPRGASPTGPEAGRRLARKPEALLARPGEAPL